MCSDAWGSFPPVLVLVLVLLSVNEYDSPAIYTNEAETHIDVYIHVSKSNTDIDTWYTQSHRHNAIYLFNRHKSKDPFQQVPVKIVAVVVDMFPLLPLSFLVVAFLLFVSKQRLAPTEAKTEGPP